MDLYISSLLLGAAGLGVMALSGLGNLGHAGHAAHGVGARGGHGHAGPGGVRHAGGPHATHAAQGASRGAMLASRNFASKTLWTLTSPRFLFSLLLGFGAAGEAVRSVLGGPLQLAVAIAGGIVLERAIVAPIWNFTMGFASKPAVTLESAVSDEATAVTSFDANGEGIVSIEVDGQVVQVLAALKAGDRELGVRVRQGQRVRIEDVDTENTRCTVSLL